MLSIQNNNQYTQNFKGNDTALKLAQTFIKSQENLSSTRFIQDSATNWAPKAIFARSKEDFFEMSFLEFLESAIFYFAPPVFGEKIFRNAFKNLSPKNLKNSINEQIPKTIKEIASNKTLSKEVQKRAIGTKAGIILACTLIPVAEYTLSFAKNLFTLKTFNKSNFNNIANLDKNKNEKEDKNQQERVEKNAKKQLKKAAVISAAGVGAGLVLAGFSHKSDNLLKISKTIVEPGNALLNTIHKLGFDKNNNEKLAKVLKSLSLDFANNKGKLALSKGQLGLTAILGLFGYSKAAKDRGKLDVAEVWTRVPLVVFYTIFGSELFEKAFVKGLDKKGKFKDLIKKDAAGNIFVPKSEQLKDVAKNIASKNGTNVKDELSKLTKQKAIVSLVPYLFSLGFMGFTLSAITRLWTQYRYNHQNKDVSLNNKQNDTLIFAGKKVPEVFSKVC